ncbi:hypothetical protein TNCV_640511 [Trichonephila clavipes]|nr:hypothetical protein TNCV_640511 [Trichonephila clavipes]
MNTKIHKHPTPPIQESPIARYGRWKPPIPLPTTTVPPHRDPRESPRPEPRTSRSQNGTAGRRPKRNNGGQ